MNTKDKIMLTALELFSKRGYKAVSVNDIAGELSLSKGALYKHYKNKREIFDSILKKMSETDGIRAAEYSLPEDEYEKMPEKYKNTKLEDIVLFEKAQFKYFACDDFACAFRKMLTIEQYNESEARRLINNYITEGPLEYLTDLFSAVGIKDAKLKAAMLYSPMALYLAIYDGAEDKKTVEKEFSQVVDGIFKIIERDM